MASGCLYFDEHIHSQLFPHSRQYCLRDSALNVLVKQPSPLDPIQVWDRLYYGALFATNTRSDQSLEYTH